MSKGRLSIRMNYSDYITSSEDGKEQNAEQESVVLEVNMVHNQKPGMQEERCGYESLDVRIWRSTDKPDEEGSARDMLHTRSHLTSIELPLRLVPSR